MNNLETLINKIKAGKAVPAENIDDVLYYLNQLQIELSNKVCPDDCTYEGGCTSCIRSNYISDNYSND